MTSEENLQEILNLSTNAGILNPPTILAGQTLRPITLASIALLQQLKSPLIAGKPIEQVENIVLDCCVFIKVQSVTAKEATKLVFGPREDLYEAAMELAENIPPTDIERVISSIIDLLKDATSTRVAVESDSPTDAMKVAQSSSELKGNA